MELSPTDLEKLHTLAIETASSTGKHIQSRVGNHGETLTKAGGHTLASQVVTEVDHESEELILLALKNSITQYELGILTEETEDDSSRLESDYFWCIDPIDGTLPFTEGVPGYSVSIALVAKNGTPVIGAVQDPVSGKLYHALKGGGASISGKPVPKNSSGSSGHLTWAMDRSMNSIPCYPELHKAMEKVAADLGLAGLKIHDQFGSVLNACKVMGRESSVYFKFPKPEKGGGSIWDFAATACLFNEWGRPVSDIRGNTLQLNPEGCTFMNTSGALYASDEILSERVQEIYREFVERGLTD
ncbi:inositol monophosphatase family protein [Verrucomicrobiales bacterium BCK34]|nr:inositol monophosphatase family protein [Verrucomicrobiales bacterium BCK34]